MKNLIIIAALLIPTCAQALESVDSLRVQKICHNRVLAADKTNKLPASMIKRICECTAQKVLSGITLADVGGANPEKLKSVYASSVTSCTNAEQ